MQALAALLGAPAPASLAELWQALVAARSKVAVSFRTTDAWFVVLSAQRGVYPINARKVAMLESVVLNASLKVAASDFRVGISTIAQAAGDCLKKMGWEATSVRMPPLISVLVHAHYGHAIAPTATQSSFVDPESGGSYVAIRVDRSAAPFLDALSQANRDVAERLIEGQSYQEIAAERRTSIRTVANQVAASFRHLGLSGRLELLRRLATYRPAVGSAAASLSA